MIQTLNCVEEAQPGAKWQALFYRGWPLYKHWFLSEGLMARKGYLSSYTMLEKCMPELIPLFNQLVMLAGGGDLEARYLSMYCPPAYMAGCSQLAIQGRHNYLIRNYDYNPQLFEGSFMYTQWLKPIMGMSDCNWGLLDGINGDGLAISLAFGGRKVMGEGFGIPLIVRYLLETCATTNEALLRIGRIPCHMAYNLTMIDNSGHTATVYLSPDNAAFVAPHSFAANQQQYIDWPYYAKLTGTELRHQTLAALCEHVNEPVNQILHHFLQKPLYSQNYHQNFGTLYTALYDTRQKTAHLHWPDEISLVQTFDGFSEKQITLHLTALKRRGSLYK